MASPSSSGSRTIDNTRFSKVLMDYTAVVFTRAAGLSSSMPHSSELLSVLSQLKSPLKQAVKYVKSRVAGDVELHELFQRLLTALQRMDEEVLLKVKWKNSTDLRVLDSALGPHIKHLEREVSALVFFLKRIGLYTQSAHDVAVSKSVIHQSSWALSRPTNEHHSSGALWPLLVLPDRNMFYLPRDDLILKTLTTIQPEKKPTHVCIVNKNGLGGLGRTQLVLEAAYKCVEKGTFGVVFWLSCASEVSLVSSYRQIARKISEIDPSFSDSLTSATGEHNYHHCTDDLLSLDSIKSKPVGKNMHAHHDVLITLVVRWLSRAPIPYLMVFDNADDSSFFNSEMFPQIGQGSIVLVTGFSQISQWTNLLKTRPKAIEATTLSYEEAIRMSECGLDTNLVSQSDRESVIEMVNYFNHSPTDFCNAILTINCMRNRSFVDIGPKEFLSRIKSNIFGPAGLVVKSQDNYRSGSKSNNNNILQRIDISYRSVLMRLYSAQDFEHACQAAQTRVMDLMAFISSQSVTTNLLYNWLSPDRKYTPMRVVIKLNRPPGLAHAPRGNDADKESTELLVEIKSCLPRMLQNSGDYCYEWNVLRTYTDLKLFFESVQPHCSSRLQKDLLSSTLQVNDKSFVLSRAVKNLNVAFAALCEDTLWPSLCDHNLIKKFLNIHTNDVCHDSKKNKIVRILDPLVAVGLVHVVHRSPILVESQEKGNVEVSGNNQDDEIIISITRGVQDTLIYKLEQDNRSQAVACQVQEFLFDCFRAETIREQSHSLHHKNEMKDIIDSSGENITKVNIICNLRRESLLPHVLRLVSMQHMNSESCIDLCDMAFKFAIEKELYNCAEVVARRMHQLLKDTNGTPSSTFLRLSKSDIVAQRRLEYEAVASWQHHIAFCIFKQGRHKESAVHFERALKARAAVCSDPESNLHIAKLELEMGDNSHCLDLYDAAIRHYETALTICKNILKDSNHESGVSKESRKIVPVLFENLTCSLLCDKKYSLALNYNDLAYEDRISEFDLFFKSTTPSIAESLWDKVMRCRHRKSRILVALGNFNEAKAYLLSALSHCNAYYGGKVHHDGSINKNFRFSFSQLKNKVILQCNLSLCYSDLAEYTDAKSSLEQAEFLIESYETYYKECVDSHELSDYSQNKKATAKLKIAVFECMIHLYVELYELESALPYTDKAQTLCTELYGCNHHETSLMVCKAGNLFKSLGRFNDATGLFKKVLTITDQNIRLDGAVVALNSLADMAATQAEFNAAENCLQDALKILQYNFKPEDVNDALIADQFILLAELKKNQLLFEDAKGYFESALKIQRSLHGDVHVSVAHTLDYLADLFSDRGEHRGAQTYREESSKIYEELRQRVLDRQENFQVVESGNRLRSTSSIDPGDGKSSHCSYGNGHGYASNKMSASALHSMASLLSSVASGTPTPGLDSIEPLHSRALRILTSQYGTNHPRVAMALNNLSKVLSKKGKQSEAQAMLETALNILRKIHGENHPHVAAAVHNLGILLGLRGFYDEAISHVESALKIRRDVASGNLLLISESLRTLGSLNYQVGNIPCCRDALEESLSLRRQLFEGVDNKYPVAISLNNLGIVLKAMLLYAQAEAYLRESLLIRMTLYGDPNVDINEDMDNKDKNYHPLIALGWNTLGGLLTSMAKYLEARKYLEHALSARKLLFGEVHADVANTLHNLADLSICEKRYGDASSLLHQVVDIRIALYGETNPLVVATVRKLWLLSIDSSDLKGKSLGTDRHEIREHSGKILFGSEQESEVFLRIKAKILRMDSNHSLPDDIADVENNAEDSRDTLNDSLNANITNEELTNPQDGVDISETQTSLLDLVMNAFEEDEDSNSAAQFLKFEAVRKAQFELNKLSQSQKSGQYADIEGGDGWPERLMQKMIHHKSTLTSEIGEQEVALIEKRSMYGQHESIVLNRRENLASLQISIQALETKVLTDKRVQYELDKLKTEENDQNAALEKLESNEAMANLRHEIKAQEETIFVRESQLKELSSQISVLEEVNNLYLNSSAVINKIDKEIGVISKKIEDCRWNMVHIKNEVDGKDNGLDSLSSVEGVHSSVVNDVAEAAMKSEIADLIRSKVDSDIARELEEVTFQRVFNKLEALRKKYKISAKSKAETIKAMVASQQASTSASNGGPSFDESISDDDSVESDQENYSNADTESQREATKGLKKKLKKQKMLIDLLRNQIVNLGHKPIAEIVTYQKAESNLQSALARLMDGDETASDDFDKWDEFVRNHPEYKAKQLRLKERFKQENLAVNQAALRMYRTIVPPGIVSTCTLVTLEKDLPKAVAKRVWQTKALWLTRFLPDRIARLHVADLQSKYSPQGLDELELRALYAALPEKFDNDAKGDKAAWCEAILQSIQSKCKALPWANDDDRSDIIEPTDEDIKSYLLNIPRNSTYRNFLTNGPYDPDEEAVVVEDVASSKDEISSQQEMLNIMGSMQQGSASGIGDVSSVNALSSGVERSEEIPTPTTSSIRRRASMFGATQKKTNRSTNVGQSKVSSTNPHPGPPKLDFFGELKLKARKRAEGESKPDVSSVKAGSSAGGMAGFLGELQNAAKKKQSRRSSVV